MTKAVGLAIEQLKLALEASEELKNYKAAKAEYNADGALTALINEYNLQASLLEQEGHKPDAERDDQLVDSISHRLRAIYDELEENPRLAAMRRAEDALAPVINAVNDAVRFAVDPDQASCTHDCSTCGGCCC